jgi:uncharacterized protein
MDQHADNCACGQCRSEADTLRMLEEHHQFPCSYMFKVIGFKGDGFFEAVRQAAEAVLGPLQAGSQLRCRPSVGDKYLAVTVEAEADNAQQVLAVYAGLRKIEGVVMLV